MAAIAPSSSSSSLTNLPPHFSQQSKPQIPFSRFTLPIALDPHKPTLLHHRRCRPFHISNVLFNPNPNTTTVFQLDTFVSRFAPNEPRKGADVLVEALEREGVIVVFAYLGGASMEIHQALTRSHTIRNVLPRHEQGGVFAAEGYARSFGLPGICIATSGSCATNLVSGLADALLGE